MHATIIVKDGVEESVEVKTYNGLKTLSIVADSVEDASRLLTDHAQDEGEHIDITPRKEETRNVKAYNMDLVNEAVHDIEHSKDGQEFLLIAQRAMDETDGSQLSVIGIRYLEALVLQGKVYEAFTTAYKMGQYSITHNDM